MLDASLDDLFSDVERSAHTIQDYSLHNAANQQDSHLACHYSALNETLSVRIRKHEDLTQILVITVTVNVAESRKSCSSVFFVPWYPTLSLVLNNSDSLDSYPSIHCCVLFPNSLLPSIHTECSGFAVPDRWIKSLQLESVNSPLIWLVSFPNGSVYRFQSGTSSTLNHCAIFTLPCYESVQHLVYFAIPRPSSGLDGILVAIGHSGNGIVMWPHPLGSPTEKNTNSFHLTEFRVPQPPASIRTVQIHGSWLHMLTGSGHILSLYFNFSDEDHLLCCCCNFPRKPMHVLPVRTISDEKHLQAKWRYFRVKDFTRLSDGHLGALHFDGEKVRLVDLLCRPEYPEPLPSCEAVCGLDLDNTVTKTRAYTALLRILGCIPMNDQSANTERSIENIFTVTSAVVINMSSQHQFSVNVTFHHPVFSKELINPRTADWDCLTANDLSSLIFHGRWPMNEMAVSIRLRPVFNHPDDISPSLYSYEDSFPTCDSVLSEHDTHESSIQASFPNIFGDESSNHAFFGLHVDVYLLVESPQLDGLSSVRSPPLQVPVYHRFFDSLNWLLPKHDVAVEYAGVDSNDYSMHYTRVSGNLLSSVLSDIMHSPSDRVQFEKDPSTLLAKGSAHCVYLPTKQPVVLKWSVMSGRTSLQLNGSRPMYSFRITCSCRRTLWVLHTCFISRVNAIPSKKVCLPCVEDLRHEYSILRSLESSLTELRQSLQSDECSATKAHVSQILDFYSILRNTASSRLFHGTS